MSAASIPPTEVRLCECHGEPLRRRGGCAVKRAEAQARYKRSEKGRAAERAASARYSRTEKGRSRDARYAASSYGKARKAERRSKQLRIGSTYLGTENSFPVPRAAVEAFALQLITQHRKGNSRKSIDALAAAE